MSRRQEQVESTLRRAVSEVLLRNMSDPRVAGLVSVTRVAVTPDLREARVFVSVVPQRHEKRAIAGLRDAAGHVHAHVARAVRMRRVPRLEFRLDESIKKESAVLSAIDEAMKRTGPADPDPENAQRPQTSPPAQDTGDAAGHAPENAKP